MRVPDDLDRTIRSWGGERGVAWLATLPRLVDELAAQWSLTLGEPYQPSGYTALALRVTGADGTPYVLKVGAPDDDRAPEADALRHYGGRAAVALLAEDAARCALLIERCDPGTPLTAEPDDDVARVVARLLGELWAPPPAGHPFRRIAEAVPRWASVIRASTLDARLRDEALDLLSWLATDEPAPVVLHGDLHAANVLRAARRPWLAIDPKGAAGDPALDAAAVIRDRAAPDLVPRRFAIVNDVLGLDPARVRAWTLVQCVEGAAWSYAVGDVKSGDEFTAAAEMVVALRVS